MKKSLFAVAVATAFAGAAQAQSSVTVYGTLDASIGQATQKKIQRLERLLQLHKEPLRTAMALYRQASLDYAVLKI